MFTRKYSRDPTAIYMDGTPGCRNTDGWVTSADEEVEWRFEGTDSVRWGRAGMEMEWFRYDPDVRYNFGSIFRLNMQKHIQGL